MFVPPRCPSPDCDAHRKPAPRFYRSKGYYEVQCRAERIPRFLCKSCGRSFSRQTFRADYRDKRPDLNVPVMQSLCDGVGLRQTARSKRIRLKNLVAKVRKIAQHCGDLHHNLMGRFDASDLPCEFTLDEAETYEGSRADRPVTLPVLIHQESFFLVDTAVGTLPPRRQARRARARQQARSRGRDRSAPVQAHPRRRSESRAACARVLRTAARHCGPTARVMLRSDLKTSYPRLARDAFGDRVVVHWRIPGKQRRDPSNPLHRINLTLALCRDLTSRLRRRSWLVSKRREQLQLHLQILTCYRNYHRRRFNKDAPDDTPAKLLGFLPRALSMQAILSWRQDWGGERSVHPLSSGGLGVQAFGCQWRHRSREEVGELASR